MAAVAVASPFVCTASAKESLAEIELTLALDTSSSMFGSMHYESRHWDLQLKGHIFALSQPEILQEFVNKRIHLRIILWSTEIQYPAIFDAGIRSEGDVLSACDVLQKFSQGCVQRICGSTVHASAIKQVLNLPQRGHHRVIDVSTDEPTLPEARAELDDLRKKFRAQSGTINALAVGMSNANVEQLQETLCTRDGFCFVAANWDDYAEALKQKIMTETA